MDIQQIEEQIKKEGVKAILLQFSDLTSRIKVVETEAHRFGEIAKFGAWYDGSSVQGHARIFESDMLLRPDLNTFAILPWTNTEFKTARVICDIYLPNGAPFAGDPRYLLKKVMAEAKELGYDYYTAAELEFFLFERSRLPELAPHDHKGYFDYTPMSRASRICRKVMDSLEAFGIHGETYHHEVAEGQHEIDIRYDNALKSADNVLTVKAALKAYASETDLKVTFMPKPIAGINGNGMHVHQSLFTGETNAFYSASDKYNLAETAYQFMAGQLKHARGLAAIVAPTINSYKRLVPGYEAPVNICWARINRSALMRIPQINPETPNATRMELRCPDPLANPYLAFAAMLAAGLDGLKNKLSPLDPVEENIYLLTDEEKEKKGITTLPASLPEALSELKQDEVLKNLLGEHTFKALLEIAESDITAARLEVTPWEVVKYL